jgi:hypothetical protein
MKTMADINISNDVTNKIVAQAKAEADAAIGISDAESETLINSATKLATTVGIATKNTIDTMSTNINRLTCADSKDSSFRNIDFANLSEEHYLMVTQSDAVVAAKNKLVQDIDAISEAHAKGWDPFSWMGMLIAVVVIIVAVVVIGGPAMFLKNLGSATFWMMGCGALTLTSLYILLSPTTGTWPAQKDQYDDSPEKRAKHAVRNAKCRKWGGILSAVFGVPTVVAGLIVFKSAKKTAPAKAQ